MADEETKTGKAGKMGGAKPERTPEQQAARKEKRKQRLAAMTPEQRAERKAKRAARKGAVDKETSGTAQ